MDYAVEAARPKGHDILVMTDANWASCRETKRSSSCLVISVGEVVVSVAARTQTALATPRGREERRRGLGQADSGPWSRRLCGCRRPSRTAASGQFRSVPGSRNAADIGAKALAACGRAAALVRRHGGHRLEDRRLVRARGLRGGLEPLRRCSALSAERGTTGQGAWESPRAPPRVS